MSHSIDLLSGYEWQQKIKNADEGIFSIEKEQEEEEKKKMIEAILSFIKNREVLNKELYGGL